VLSPSIVVCVCAFMCVLFQTLYDNVVMVVVVLGMCQGSNDIA